jgi:hypothetical protein
MRSLKFKKPVGSIIRRIACFSHEWARLGKAAAKSQNTNSERPAITAAEL